MTVFFVLAALLLLGIMVMVHECGHFFAARLTGIPVKGFGIGFGVAVIDAGETGPIYCAQAHRTRFA